MAAPDRIALIKTGWSDDYAGGHVVGRHAHISQRGEGHERFNFFPGPTGRFYGYAPPIGGFHRPPQPTHKTGWLLVYVAARNGNGPLVVVGWYRNATIASEYEVRPEYDAGSAFETDLQGHPYTYCLSARSARLVPVAGRRLVIPGDRFRRTPVLYLRGNGRDAPWREALARKVIAFISSRRRGSGLIPPSFAFPDTEHRKKVEEAAVASVKKRLKRRYQVASREKEKLGYDLLAVDKAGGGELHVEVKGTSGTLPHFFMTRKEHAYMSDPRWRLAIVTEALASPRVRLLTAAEVHEVIEVCPFAFEGVAKLP